MNKYAFIVLSLLAVILFILMIIFESGDNENVSSVTKDSARRQAEQKVTMREQPPTSVKESRAVFQKSETYTSKVPANGLVAYYPFNGNADDASGNGNHGTVHGATLTEDRFGNPNSAYYFDGIDDEIAINNPDILNNTKAITINIVFMLKQQRSHFSPIIYKGETKFDSNNQPINERTFSFWITKFGELHLAGADHIGQQHLNIPRNFVKPGVWYNYTGVIDRNKGKIFSYIDGHQIAQDNIRTNEPVRNSNPVLIATTRERNDRFTNFNGVIDEIRFFDRALDHSEIINLNK